MDLTPTISQLLESVLTGESDRPYACSIAIQSMNARTRNDPYIIINTTANPFVQRDVASFPATTTLPKLSRAW
jgi:hypothetical protein